MARELAPETAAELIVSGFVQGRGERSRLRVTVQTYAGYRGDERPVSFSREGLTFQVAEIVDRWYDPDHAIFKVLADDGKTCLLRHDMNADLWELIE